MVHGGFAAPAGIRPEGRRGGLHGAEAFALVRAAFRREEIRPGGDDEGIDALGVGGLGGDDGPEGVLRGDGRAGDGRAVGVQHASANDGRAARSLRGGEDGRGHALDRGEVLDGRRRVPSTAVVVAPAKVEVDVERAAVVVAVAVSHDAVAAVAREFHDHGQTRVEAGEHRVLVVGRGRRPGVTEGFDEGARLGAVKAGGLAAVVDVVVREHGESCVAADLPDRLTRGFTGGTRWRIDHRVPVVGSAERGVPRRLFGRRRGGEVAIHVPAHVRAVVVHAIVIAFARRHLGRGIAEVLHHLRHGGGGAAAQVVVGRVVVVAELIVHTALRPRRRQERRHAEVSRGRGGGQAVRAALLRSRRRELRPFRRAGGRDGRTRFRHRGRARGDVALHEQRERIFRLVFLPRAGGRVGQHRLQERVAGGHHVSAARKRHDVVRALAVGTRIRLCGFRRGERAPVHGLSQIHPALRRCKGGVCGHGIGARREGRARCDHGHNRGQRLCRCFVE